MNMYNKQLIEGDSMIKKDLHQKYSNVKKTSGNEEIMYQIKQNKYKKKRRAKINVKRFAAVMTLLILTIVLSCKIIVGKINESNIKDNKNNEITDLDNNMSKGEDENTNKYSDNNLNNDKENNDAYLGIEIQKNIPLINKEYGISRGYEPSDLREFNALSNKTIMLRDEAADNAERLFEDAASEGIYLMAAAGFRTYEYQEQLYNNEVANSGKAYADKYVAKPGHSEHHTGLVIDLMRASDVSLTEDFDKTAEFRWLQENMSDYGFILRYPKGKESITGYNYEPWHIRYVGVEAAKEIEKSGLTLEEYLNK